MGSAACRMKERRKAMWALKHMGGRNKTKLQQICAGMGVELALR